MNDCGARNLGASVWCHPLSWGKSFQGGVAAV